MSDEQVVNPLDEAEMGGAVPSSPEELTLLLEDARSKADEAHYHQENWHILDATATGLRLSCPDREGASIRHNQLLAVRLPDCHDFLLGTVKWLMHSLNHELQIGVHILAGIPRAIAARPVSINPNNSNKYVAAFLLQALEAKSPSSLIVPFGWFHPARHVEIFREDQQTVRLQAVLDSGSDYEQVSFEDFAMATKELHA